MPLTKALIINTDETVPVPIPVMFNPPEYSLQKSNQFAEVTVPGLGSAPLQFVKGNVESLNMELFFDTTDTGMDVRNFTESVVGLTAINAQTHAPPRLLFVWGSLAFPCILESVTQRFDYFNPAGLPLRARLTVVLKAYDVLESLLASIPLESADRVKSWIVKTGDTLQGVAAIEYGDATQWRPIAQASDIDNPLILQPGQTLTIPTLN